MSGAGKATVHQYLLVVIALNVSLLLLCVLDVGTGVLCQVFARSLPPVGPAWQLTEHPQVQLLSALK
jgi:hypothetical protein